LEDEGGLLVLNLNILSRFVREEEGLELVEYALVALLFATVAALIFTPLAEAVTGAIQSAISILNGGSSS
jgi:Flp pilus assembly pilin Flp